MTNKFRRVAANRTVLLIVLALIAGVVGFTTVAKLTSKKTIVTAKNCQGICVKVSKEGMNPDTLTVKVGEYVQFNSADGQQHNLGLGEGEASKSTDHQAHAAQHEHIGDFSSGDFNADEAWRVQFKEAGTYKFHDHYNPKLYILIVAYEPGGPKKLST